MRTAVAILAAGKSERLGLDKTLEMLGDRPVWRWSYDTYLSHPDVDEILVVVSSSNAAEIGRSASWTIEGGQTREESARNALRALSEFDVVLFHDAGRPFVDQATITRTLDAIASTGVAAACMPVKDTIRERLSDGSRTLDRSSLLAMQTPQGARVAMLVEAFEGSDGSATDDIALLERHGHTCAFVAGSDLNFKITTMEDLASARSKIPAEYPRIGSGYDVHPFSDDLERPMMLGGVHFEGSRSLDGHSDADVLLHAITDAILGAASLGDIGQHFPNTDSQWKNAPSLLFLKAAGEMVAEAGWMVVNVDSTVIAEEPKVMKRAAEIRVKVSEALGIDPSQISVKATTNEKLGFIGRSEGIAAIATALIAPLR